VQFKQYYEILHCCSEFFLTEVPVLSQAFLRSASTQYQHIPAHFKPCLSLDTQC